MRTFAFRFGVIFAVCGSIVAMGACGAEGENLEDATAPTPDATAVETSVKDAPLDRTVGDGGDASDAKSDQTVVDADAADADAKADVVDASDASDASDATDADADAWSPEGTPCTTSGAVEARACGGCGTQERVCLDLGAGMKWQSWGSCKNEVVGGCVPGSVTFEECDLCGRRRKECTSSCTWITGICENQNPNACEPGVVEWVEALSCDAGTGRTRNCSYPQLDAAPDAPQTGCSWSNYAPSCTTAPTSITIPSVSGERIGQSVTLTGSMPYVTYASTLLDAGCSQTTSTSSSYQVPFAYVELINPTAQTANITVWGTMAADSGVYDGMRIVAYSGSPNPPANLATCLSQDSCSSTSCKLDAGFGLQNDAGVALYYSPRVTIPPNGKLVILVTESYNYYAYTTLPVLWVRTDSFTP
jgi:hypothetical protein